MNGRVGKRLMMAWILTYRYNDLDILINNHEPPPSPVRALPFFFRSISLQTKCVNEVERNKERRTRTPKDPDITGL